MYQIWKWNSWIGKNSPSDIYIIANRHMAQLSVVYYGIILVYSSNLITCGIMWKYAPWYSWLKYIDEPAKYTYWFDQNVYDLYK